MQVTTRACSRSSGGRNNIFFSLANRLFFSVSSVDSIADALFLLRVLIPRIRRVFLARHGHLAKLDRKRGPVNRAIIACFVARESVIVVSRGFERFTNKGRELEKVVFFKFVSLNTIIKDLIGIREVLMAKSRWKVLGRKIYLLTMIYFSLA